MHDYSKFLKGCHTADKGRVGTLYGKLEDLLIL